MVCYACELLGHHSLVGGKGIQPRLPPEAYPQGGDGGGLSWRDHHA